MLFTSGPIMADKRMQPRVKLSSAKLILTTAVAVPFYTKLGRLHWHHRSLEIGD
jgi:hypothetical protein